ncbi:malonate transporter subunit MadM, partial [Acinetobacter baumannii]|nr:malonate transporter subunit MadM [Acinetobacter baumannii]
MVELLLKDLTHLGLITAFALIALIMWLSTKLSKYLTN